MIHNFIKSFKNEKLKNVLHTVFAKYDSNNTKVDGLNDHIENILNTVDKNDIAELNKALNEINSGEEFEKVYDEELEEINDSNEIYVNVPGIKMASFPKKFTEFTNLKFRDGMKVSCSIFKTYDYKEKNTNKIVGIGANLTFNSIIY